LRSESSGQNSPWIAREIVRTIGSSGVVWTVRGLREGSVEVARVIVSYRVARWLEAGETHHPGFEGQYEPLISFQPTSSDHFVNLRFVSLEGRPNSWFS
jgi:hypothetical protein